MITSRTNDKIKYIEKLKQKSSFRKEEGFFVVEGIRMIREVPDNLRKELYLTEKAIFVDTDLVARETTTLDDGMVSYPWIVAKCELYDVPVNFK